MRIPLDMCPEYIPYEAVFVLISFLSRHLKRTTRDIAPLLSLIPAHLLIILSLLILWGRLSIFNIAKILLKALQVTLYKYLLSILLSVFALLMYICLPSVISIS